MEENIGEGNIIPHCSLYKDNNIKVLWKENYFPFKYLFNEE
jgi:hypothetical protein